MVIFRKIGTYLALIGISLVIVLVNKIRMAPPPLDPVNKPAVNPYSNTVAAAGIIESVDRNISISVPLPGLVKEVYVEIWDKVEKDQPLFQIDDRDLLAQLLVLEANVNVAQAHVNRLKDQLKRLQAIEDPRAISQDELKTKFYDVSVAEAELDTAYAQVEQTMRLIDRLTIRAPKDGVILQSNIRPGEHISPSMSVPAMLLGNLEKLQVRADVDEQNAFCIDSSCPATAFPKNNALLAIPLTFDRIEPYVTPKKALTGASEERVDTRVLQVIYSFEKLEDFPMYVGQQVDVFIGRKNSLTKEKETASTEKTEREDLPS